MLRSTRDLRLLWLFRQGGRIVLAAVEAQRLNPQVAPHSWTGLHESDFRGQGSSREGGEAVQVSHRHCGARCENYILHTHSVRSCSANMGSSLISAIVWDKQQHFAAV